MSQAKFQSQMRLSRQEIADSPTFTEGSFKMFKKLTILAVQHQTGTKQLSRNVGINIT